MDALLQDLRYALRALKRSPGFAAVVVLTLALGIGANSAMFSVAYGFLWEPRPVAHPEELVTVFRYNPRSRDYNSLSYPDYRDVRAQTAAFADAIAYIPYPFALSGDGRNERTYGEIVSGNYFAMLGVRPAAGRFFGEAEGGRGAASVAVISDALWRRRYHEDVGVVGRPLKINGVSFTIVGVAPRKFEGVYYVGFQPDLWIPAGQFDAVVPGVPGSLDDRDGQGFRVMGRLAPGVRPQQAQLIIGALMARLGREYPVTHAGLEARVLTEREARPEPGIADGFTLAARLFLGAVALVLLIACFNVANLLLARATSRRKEIAVRLALGASRARLIRQLLVESLLLAGIGGALGVGLGAWAGSGLGVMLRLPTDFPFAFDFPVDGPVLAYSAAVALAAGVVFGLAPALQAVRPELVGALKNDAMTVGGFHRSRLRSALVVGQIAVACVLLVLSGLAVRTLGRLREVDPGFDTRGALLVNVAPDLQRYDRARGIAFYRQLVARVRELPGVRQASLAEYVPLDFSSNGGRIFVEGHEATGTDARGQESATWSQVTPGFFATMGSPPERGREFTERDDSAAPRVVIVNETLARLYWPGQDAIGRRLRLESPDSAPYTVIGVVHDWKYNNLMEPRRPCLFVPLEQKYEGYATLVVRVSGNPRALAPAVSRVVGTLDPDMPLSGVRTFADLMSGRALILPRFGATLAGGFGVLALLLAVVGLYGVVAFGVGQRVREIGIRVALGAGRGSVVAMIMRGGLVQAGAGVGIGVVLALVATRAARSLLFGVGATDLLTFAGVALLLTAVAAVASWIPARRAARTDPMVALRSE